MKSSTKNKAEGKMHQIKGSLKEGIGAAINDRELEVDGKIEVIKGKAQEKTGLVEKVLGR